MNEEKLKEFLRSLALGKTYGYSLEKELEEIFEE